MSMEKLKYQVMSFSQEKKHAILFSGGTSISADSSLTDYSWLHRWWLCCVCGVNVKYVDCSRWGMWDVWSCLVSFCPALSHCCCCNITFTLLLWYRYIFLFRIHIPFTCDVRLMSDAELHVVCVWVYVSPSPVVRVVHCVPKKTGHAYYGQ